ncbi:MAG: DinB family protein [Gemmatimonadales bacterium]|nr:DinB family protein [Gemmatimonadales bacterium]
MSLTATVEAMLLRELATLRRELEAYHDERLIWCELPGLPNTAGTLALHLAGNLQHYLGARLGGTGYVRDRPAEFSRSDVPRAELLAEVDRATAAVSIGLRGLAPDQLESDFPEPIAATAVPTGDYLLQLVAHAAFHVGQVDYHRRAVTGDSRSVGPLQPVLPAVARRMG